MPRIVFLLIETVCPDLDFINFALDLAKTITFGGLKSFLDVCLCHTSNALAMGIKRF